MIREMHDERGAIIARCCLCFSCCGPRFCSTFMVRIRSSHYRLVLFLVIVSAAWTAMYFSRTVSEHHDTSMAEAGKHRDQQAHIHALGRMAKGDDSDQLTVRPSQSQEFTSTGGYGLNQDIEKRQGNILSVADNIRGNVKDNHNEVSKDIWDISSTVSPETTGFVDEIKSPSGSRTGAGFVSPPPNINSKVNTQDALGQLKGGGNLIRDTFKETGAYPSKTRHHFNDLGITSTETSVTVTDTFDNEINGNEPNRNNFLIMLHGKPPFDNSADKDSPSKFVPPTVRTSSNDITTIPVYAVEDPGLVSLNKNKKEVPILNTNSLNPNNNAPSPANVNSQERLQLNTNDNGVRFSKYNSRPSETNKKEIDKNTQEATEVTTRQNGQVENRPHQASDIQHPDVASAYNRVGDGEKVQTHVADATQGNRKDSENAKDNLNFNIFDAKDELKDRQTGTLSKQTYLQDIVSRNKVAVTVDVTSNPSLPRNNEISQTSDPDGGLIKTRDSSNAENSIKGNAAAQIKIAAKLINSMKDQSNVDVMSSVILQKKPESVNGNAVGHEATKAAPMPDTTTSFDQIVKDFVEQYQITKKKKNVKGDPMPDLNPKENVQETEAINLEYRHKPNSISKGSDINDNKITVMKRTVESGLKVDINDPDFDSDKDVSSKGGKNDISSDTIRPTVIASIDNGSKDKNKYLSANKADIDNNNGVDTKFIKSKIDTVKNDGYVKNSGVLKGTTGLPDTTVVIGNTAPIRNSNDKILRIEDGQQYIVNQDSDDQTKANVDHNASQYIVQKKLPI